MLDIPHQLATQVRDGGEDAPRGHVPLNLCKPELDLVQPRRIGRRVVELNVGMSHQERPDLLRLVRGKVVDDDVDLATPRLRVDNVLENPTNSSLVCRGAVWPSTSPVRVFNAA